jgi:Ca2+/Na+ antiporter
MIRSLLAIGVVLYSAIALIQITSRPVVRGESVFLSLLFLLIVAILWSRDKNRIKTVEMIVIWICVLFFAGYAILILGGLL